MDLPSTVVTVWMGRLDGCIMAVFVVCVSTVAGALRLPTTAGTGPAPAPAPTVPVSEDAHISAPMVVCQH